jgi:hypothetical protein
MIRTRIDAAMDTALKVHHRPDRVNGVDAAAAGRTFSWLPARGSAAVT